VTTSDTKPTHALVARCKSCGKICYAAVEMLGNEHMDKLARAGATEETAKLVSLGHEIERLPIEDVKASTFCFGGCERRGKARTRRVIG